MEELRASAKRRRTKKKTKIDKAAQRKIDVGPCSVVTQRSAMIEKIEIEKKGIDLHTREGLRVTNALWTSKYFMIPTLNEFGKSLLRSGDGKCNVECIVLCA